MFQSLLKAYLTGDWMIILSVTFITGQSDNGLYFSGAAQGGAPSALLMSSSASLSATSLAASWTVCVEMGVTAHQGEVSTDPAWRSDSFLPKNGAEGALKARQLRPGLFLAQATHTSRSHNFADRRTVRTRHQKPTGRYPKCQCIVCRIFRATQHSLTPWMPL